MVVLFISLLTLILSRILIATILGNSILIVIESHCDSIPICL